MIESLELLNFQAHRKRRVDFDQISTIIGPTEAGKSTLLRALRWAFLNDFPGPADSFIRWGRSLAKTTVVVDGRELVRKKGKNGNLYILDGKEFRSFGAGKVPDEVAQFLRITELNFQDQDDTHFWLSSSAAEVSRQLNRIVNLTAIDNALANVAARCRRAKAEVEVGRDRLAKAREQRAGLKWVPAVADQLADLEAREARIATRASRIAAIRSLASRAKEAKQVHRDAAAAAQCGEVALIAGSRAIEAGERVVQLRELLAGLRRAKAAARLTIPQLPSRQLQRAEELGAKAAHLSVLLSQIKQWKDKLWHAKDQLARTEAKLKRASTGWCPVCGQKMS